MGKAFHKVLRSFYRGAWRWMREPRVWRRWESDAVQVTVEVQTWLPVAVFLFLLGWYLAAPTGVVTMALLGMGGVLVADFGWARAMARSVRGQRRLRFVAMQVGDELEEELSLENKNALIPVLWAEFFDRSNIPGYTVSSARAAGAASEVRWRAHTTCTRRGVFNLGPWELQLGTPFGLFLVRQVYHQRQEILVYPPMAALPDHLLPHRGALGGHRPLNQPLPAETIASTTVRGYHPGDPLRHIHWRTTARRVDPYVKVFEPEAASKIWLVPDFDARYHLEAGEISSVETMVTVTASLAAALLQKNLAVGMIAAAQPDAAILPRLGQAYLWSLLQALAPLQAAPGRKLEDLLGRARPLLTGNDLLIVITPALHPDWVGALQRLTPNRGGLGRAEVILLDPASFGGEAQADRFLPFLLAQGLPAAILRREDVTLISGYYGEVSRWEFKVLGTGRAVARRTPRAAEIMAGEVRHD